MVAPVRLEIELPDASKEQVLRLTERATVTTCDGLFLQLEVAADAAPLLAGFLAAVLQEPVTVRRGGEVEEVQPQPSEAYEPFQHFLSRWDRKAARVGKGSGVYLHSAEAPVYGPEERLPIEFPGRGEI